MDSFQPNCWSEHEELKVVMLCAPSKLDVPDLSIAENVGWDAAVNHVKAMDNFMGFKTTLENAGVKVIDYSEELSTDVKTVSEQLINRYFVRDLACVIGNSIFYGAAGSSLRRPEYPHAHSLLEKWFPEKKLKNLLLL